MTGKKKRPKDSRKSQSTVSERTRFMINVGYLRFGCQAIFVLFCFFIFVRVHSDLFRIIGELAFFQDSWSYFYERMGTVGGPLRYLSDVLTSFFLFPTVGAFILVVFLLLIQMACGRLFRLGGALVPLSFLPFPGSDSRHRKEPEKDNGRLPPFTNCLRTLSTVCRFRQAAGRTEAKGLVGIFESTCGAIRRYLLVFSTLPFGN